MHDHLVGNRKSTLFYLTTMNWIKLTALPELDAAITASYKKPVVLFKHSTRCSISSTALSRFERNWNNEAETTLVPYFIDLIAYREISNAIADKTTINHESPQAILLVDGQAVFNASHLDIRLKDLVEVANQTLSA
jgi:bacillithiol system protein YtxJ